MRHVLGCAVPDALWQRWEPYMAPTVQPFFVPEALMNQLPPLPHWTREELRAMELPLTLRDTLRLYNVNPDLPWVLMLDEARFRSLPPGRQMRLLETQLDGGRGGVQRKPDWRERLPETDAALIAHQADLFLWWPGLWWRLSGAGRETVLLDFLTEDRLPHRGAELTAAHWARIETQLPGVRPLAGTFALESGANCFSTVLAAFGHLEVADLWLHRAPFERWLADTRPTTEPDSPGSMLVWRDGDGRLQHAAVSLGEGWVFQKDAQGWDAPRQIVALPDLLARWDTPGWPVRAYRR